jgi:AraC-like DNA-binding protein
MHTITLHQQQHSTRNISTTMAPIDEAIAFLRSSDQLPIAEVARRFNVSRSTLSKRFQGKTGSLAKRAESNQLLSNKQELVLVEHIRCCKYASAVCYSLWLYYGMLLEDYMDRVSGRSLTETSTLEMAVDRRRQPSTAGGGLIP